MPPMYSWSRDCVSSRMKASRFFVLNTRCTGKRTNDCGVYVPPGGGLTVALPGLGAVVACQPRAACVASPAHLPWAKCGRPSRPDHPAQHVGRDDAITIRASTRAPCCPTNPPIFDWRSAAMFSLGALNRCHPSVRRFSAFPLTRGSESRMSEQV